MKPTYEDLQQQLAALDAINRQLNERVVALLADNWNLRDVLRQLINGRPGGTYFIKWEGLCFKALNEPPATEAAIAEIRNEIASPLVNALTTIANSEQINGDGFVCDFDTLVSVAAGALRNHYAQQLRAEASK